MARTRQTAQITAATIRATKSTNYIEDDVSNVKKILTEYNEILFNQNKNEQDLNERYRNDEPLVKVWISQDQRNSKIVKEENDNITLQKQLKELTLDLKYEIISFIPTYSNTYLSINKLYINKMAEQVLNPKGNGAFGYTHFQGKNTKPRNREEEENNKKKMVEVVKSLLEPSNIKEESKFTMDSKLVTLHKMRLINKEFNRRMKLKILNLDHLNLDFILIEGTKNTDAVALHDQFVLKKLKLWKLMNLLKHQKLYNEFKENIDFNDGHLMKTILQLDHIGLYNNEPLDDFFNENNSSHSTGPFGGFSLGGTASNNNDFDEESSDSYSDVFEKTTLGNNIIKKEKTEIMDIDDSGDEAKAMIESEENNKKEEKMLTDTVDIFKLPNEELINLEQQLLKKENIQTDSKVYPFSLAGEVPDEEEEDKSLEQQEHFKRYYNTKPVGFLITSNFYSPFPSNNAFKSNITEYIGENNTIKSIQFNCNLFNNFVLKEDLKFMLKCLKNLTTIDFINYNEGNANDFFNSTSMNMGSLPSVKEVNIIFVESFDFSFVTNLVNSKQLQQFENLERINVFPIYDEGVGDLKEASAKTILRETILNTCSDSTTNDLFVFIERNPITKENTIYFQSNNDNNFSDEQNDKKREIEINFTLLPNFRKEDWIRLTTTYLHGNSANSEILNNPFLSCLKSMDLSTKKFVLEYWIKNNYLLIDDIIPHLLPEIDNNETLCIIQYLIYLSNEYHNGRLFNGLRLYRVTDCLSFLQLVKFGYAYEKQIMELILLIRSPNYFEEIIPLLVEALPFEKENNHLVDELVQVFSVMSSDPVFFEYFLPSLCQRYGKDVIKKILLHPVYCFTYHTHELIYLPFILMLFNCDTYFIGKLINRLEPEDILSIKDDIDNNLCQLFISLNSHNIDDHFILKIIEKVPELAYTKNKEGETLLHTCCFLLKEAMGKKVNLIYYLIKDIGVPYDLPDNKGRTAKQLLEEKTLSRILFQYEDKDSSMEPKRKHLLQ